MTLRIESTGFSDAKRILADYTLVGMAVRYTSGFWAAHDVDNKVLTRAVYPTPTGVRNYFRDLS